MQKHDSFVLLSEIVVHVPSPMSLKSYGGSQIGIWKCCSFFQEGGKPENWEKNPWSKVRTNNKLNLQMTNGQNRIRAIMVGGEHSRHYASPAPKLKKAYKDSFKLTSSVTNSNPGGYSSTLRKKWQKPNTRSPIPPSSR